MTSLLLDDVALFNDFLGQPHPSPRFCLFRAPPRFALIYRPGNFLRVRGSKQPLGKLKIWPVPRPLWRFGRGLGNSFASNVLRRSSSDGGVRINIPSRFGITFQLNFPITFPPAIKWWPVVRTMAVCRETGGLESDKLFDPSKKKLSLLSRDSFFGPWCK